MAQDNKGWQGERGRHAKAGKGEKASGSGFHGHPKEHAKAAKGESATKSESLLDKLKK
jgi:hypothetical protein